MRKIPELLVPAGGLLQLQAAVENGADAVYLGGKQFNARMNAGNFDRKELTDAIAYAHLRGVKVHLTMNTLLSDKELPCALDEAIFAYEAGIDALIVQELGLADTIHRVVPELELHLSTQGTVYNPQGVRQAAELGFSRVVLAREVSLEEIRAIASDSDTEIEIFVHGALCICYSGQCHMSRTIGGRSGNRGVCAQPCRLPYELVGEDEYNRFGCLRKGALLSPKDLCLLDYLPQIAEAGVASIKVEGRMKSPEYVGMVTAVYRKYLDMYLENGMYVVEEQDRNNLRQVFNRGGFSAGYFEGNPRDELMSGELSKHQGVFIGVVVSQDIRRKQVRILLEDKLSMGDGIEIRSTGPSGTALPGNVVTYLRRTGENVNSEGDAGDCVTVGDIAGACNPGDSVYKITDRKLMEWIRSSYEQKDSEAQQRMKKRAISISVSAELAKPVCITLWDLTSDICVEMQSEELCEKARTRPLTEELIQTQLGKTGGTLFRVCHWDIQLEEGISIPISVLNGLRRDGLRQLEEQLVSQQRRSLPEDVQNERKSSTFTRIRSLCTASDEGGEPKLSVYLHRADKEAVSLAALAMFLMPDGRRKRVSRLYVPYSLFLTEAESELDGAAGGMELVPYLPAITKGVYDVHIEKNLKQLLAVAVKRGIAIGNLGWIHPFTEAGVPVIGDYGLNLYSSTDFLLALEMGLHHGVISHEFEGEQEIAGVHGISCEMAIGGSIPLMTSAHCFIGDLRGNDENAVKNCSLCDNKRYFLKDRKNENYIILSNKKDCSCMILPEKMEIDRKKYGYCLSKSVSYMRIYGIDKSLFCERTEP